MSNRPCVYCNTKISMREALPPATLIRFFEMKRVCKKCGLEELEFMFGFSDCYAGKTDDMTEDQKEKAVEKLRADLKEQLENFTGPFAPLSTEERAERGITNPNI